MRVGKKLKVVETKKTRSCVVRLENIRTPPGKSSRGNQNATSSASNTKAHLNQDEKKTKGPLKKRPIAQTSPLLIPKMKEKSLIKIVPKVNPKVVAKVVPKVVAKAVTKVVATPTPRTPRTPPTTPAIDLATPTIAAGRSRRAIKPNPKYASEDIVTPKMIKNATMQKKTTSESTTTDKKRKRSTSSSEDFYNKDDSSFFGEFDEKDDKPYQDDDKDSDSDFSDIQLQQTVRAIKARNRSTNFPQTGPLDKVRTPSTATTAATTSIAKVTKSTKLAPPSQLQQLRKTLMTSNANRLSSNTTSALGLQTAKKRKPNRESSYDSLSDSDTDHMAKRRKMFASNKTNKPSTTVGAVSQSLSLNQKSLMSRKSLASQTLNGNKVLLANAAKAEYNMILEKRKSLMEKANSISMSEKRRSIFENTLKADSALLLEKRKSILERTSKADSTMLLEKRKSLMEKTPKADSELILEKRKSILERAMAKVNVKPPPVKMAKPNNLQEQAPVKSIATTKQTSLRQRTSSPALSKASNAVAKVAEKKIEASPSATIDDFETMPTFTIVNINDIINKKGDVLISKANDLASPKDQSKKSDDEDNLGSEADSMADFESEDDNVVKKPATGTKQNRRKAGHTTILTEKVDSARQKNPSSRTPFPTKKPAQTILNHTLNKNSNKTNQRGMRASNAKTSGSNKPAPRILNAMVAKKTQPVKPLIANMDDSADDTYPLSYEDENDEEEEDEEQLSGRRRTSTPYLANKPPPGTKENSLAATNLMPARGTPQRKLSPEKVVISRQGDKIIKKITCFETWYIINMPEERPAEVVRNTLEVPLIKLANASKRIELPSAKWSSKVTLQQLAATLLAKSSYTTYTGDLTEQSIDEEDRAKYQPSCVMFRRCVSDRTKSRLPYDRAVIFKNKTFFTNIEGKNVKLVGAPFKISSLAEVEILLQLVDELTLQSAFVEQTATVQ